VCSSDLKAAGRRVLVLLCMDLSPALPMGDEVLCGKETKNLFVDSPQESLVVNLRLETKGIA